MADKIGFYISVFFIILAVLSLLSEFSWWVLGALVCFIFSAWQFKANME